MTSLASSPSSLPSHSPLMLSLDAIHALLEDTPGLAASITLGTITSFIHIMSSLKDVIINDQPLSFDPTTIPSVLPERVLAYVTERLQLSHQMVCGLWHALSISVWTHAADLEDSRTAAMPRMHDHIAEDFLLGKYYI